MGNRSWWPRLGGGGGAIAPGLLLISVVLIGPPLFFLIWTSLTPGPGITLIRPFSFDAYLKLFGSDATFFNTLRQTAVFALGSAAGALVLGSVLAWLVARTDVKGKWLVYLAVFLSFAIPGMIEVIGWILLLGSGAGQVNVLLQDLFGVGVSFPIQSIEGMILVQSLSLAPVVFLLLVGPLRMMDKSLEESATMCGASRLRCFRRITLPLLLPSLLSVLILVIIRAVQAFEVPLFLGQPAGVRTLTTEVYNGLHESFIPDYSRSAAFGVILMAALLVAIWYYQRVTRDALKFVTVTSRGFRPQSMALGRFGWLGTVLIVLVALLYVAPVLAVLLESFRPGARAPGQSLLSGLSLENYRVMLRQPELLGSVTNSAVIGLLSATLVVFLCLAAAWAIGRTKSRGRAALSHVLSLPLAIPGTVLGLAVLVTFVYLPIPVYGTIAIFVIAYVVHFAPYGLRYVQPALAQIHPNLEESAQVSGARMGAVFWRILTPLLVPALLGSWLYVFFHSFRDLSVAAMLYTADTNVVSTLVMTMWQEGSLNVLSSFGVLISVLSIAVAAGAYSYGRRLGVPVE